MGKAAQRKNSFPAVPLIVIGRDPEHAIELAIQNQVPPAEPKALEAVWQQLLQEQMQLSPNANNVLAHQSGHSIHLDRPDDIADAIHSCLYPRANEQKRERTISRSLFV